VTIVQQNAEQRGVEYALSEPELIEVESEPLIPLTRARETRLRLRDFRRTRNERFQLSAQTIRKRRECTDRDAPSREKIFG
jgi:hypothetical protein